MHACRGDGYLLSRVGGRRVYFVHSFRATPSPETEGCIAATSDYGGPFVAALQRGNLCATQFHPEKSGAAGLDVLRSFLDGQRAEPVAEPSGNGEDKLKRWLHESAVVVVPSTMDTGQAWDKQAWCSQLMRPAKPRRML